MSLLRQIQDAAIDSKADVASLLRRCKVLAARLSSSEFKEWVENELSGYDSTEELPDYRIVEVNSKGHFSGAFGSGLRNADIPIFSIPEQLREGLERSYFTMPVAAMESLIQNSSEGTLQEAWNPNLVAVVGSNIYQNMNCMQAWKVIPTASLVAALDAVRTRVLNFVLEIEATDPTAGEAQLNSNPIPQEKIHQIFNTYVTGNIQNLATGNAGDVSQEAKSSEVSGVGTLNDLLAAIRKSDIPSEVRPGLESSINGMRSTLGERGFKDHYHKFMGSLADHMQVLGPVVAPFLPALSALLP